MRSRQEKKVGEVLKFEGDFEVDEVDNVEEQRWVVKEQSHVEVYDCLKGGSGNSGGKRLAISMVEEE
ncbi:hypothetical protein Tco_1540333 [Tanacetum coccineum]